MRNIHLDKNSYIVDIDGEVFETYIPSPEEEAAQLFRDKYGFDSYESWKAKWAEQRADRIEDQHYRWGTPQTQ